MHVLVVCALLFQAPPAAPAAPAAPASPIPAQLPAAKDVPERAGLIPNGSFAPDFALERLDAEGGFFRLSDHVGPVAAADPGGPDAAIVAFMASWCGICHQSLPALRSLKEEHGQRLLLVVVSTDATEEKARAEAARIAAAGVEAAVVRGDAATLKAWLGADRGVPRYFFVNRIGEILVKDRGFGKKVAAVMPKQARYALSHPEYVER